MTPQEETSQNDATAMRRQLLEDGFILDPEAEVSALTGGISSDIYRVVDGDRIFVIKRALEKLRVKDDWHADISRNRYELAYLQCVSRFLPKAVPEVLFSNPEQGYFAMEYLGGNFANWKEVLLSGDCRDQHAEIAGSVLGMIHRHTWGDENIQSDFESTDNFHQLRIEPYLLTTADRHPELANWICTEADRLRNTRLCLVHGDYSPKNLMLSDNRLIVLDCEVAWYGDPVFDVAFLLNHLLLKALHLDAHRLECVELARIAWQAYRNELGETYANSDLAPHLPTMLPMLMLARVDGKSPLEYLCDEKKKQTLRDFTYQAHAQRPKDVTALFDNWLETLNHNY